MSKKPHEVKTEFTQVLDSMFASKNDILKEIIGILILVSRMFLFSSRGAKIFGEKYFDHIGNIGAIENMIYILS